MLQAVAVLAHGELAPANRTGSQNERFVRDKTQISAALTVSVRSARRIAAHAAESGCRQVDGSVPLSA